jgi:hypothetical protein
MKLLPLQWPRLSERWTKPSLLWLLPILAAGFIAWYWDQTAPTETSPLRAESFEAADTYIPSGFVLVPIEVANYEALDSILGKFGVVDLFVTSSEPGKRPLKVAEKIKILRAPLNPSRFAVLAPESESPRLVSHPGPFLVIVQNPKTAGRSDRGSLTVSEDQTGHAKRARSRIEVEVTHAD